MTPSRCDSHNRTMHAEFACTHALANSPPTFWTISSHFSFCIFAHLYLFLHLGPTNSTCKVFTRPNNKQQQCSTVFHPTTRITLPMSICATCIPLSYLPSLVMLLSETHVALLIKDKQCTEIHPNRPLSHQSICALLTKPTATFGVGRHSPNVQLHVTPAVVFIVVVLVACFTTSAALKTGCLLPTSLATFCCNPHRRRLLAGQGEGRGGGVGFGGKLSRFGFETKCCGGSATLQDRFRLTRMDTETKHGRTKFSNERITECATSQPHI